MRGGYKESAVGREAEGIDGFSVSFESIPYVFHIYFPDLKMRSIGKTRVNAGERPYIDASIT